MKGQKKHELRFVKIEVKSNLLNHSEQTMEGLAIDRLEKIKDWWGQLCANEWLHASNEQLPYHNLQKVMSLNPLSVTTSLIKI